MNWFQARILPAQLSSPEWNFNSGEIGLLDSNRSSYFHVPDNTKQSVYEDI